ncbi:MAG: 3-ketodihydrosphingosine reductase [Herpetosiphonaceae bacterium]|nr:MAG: 3-ketodihydrosphingosine reductase [Herpetosiphonaceae bacterium]
MEFHQQHIIITGGSSGIGKAVACLFAREGANLTIIARDPAKLEAAKAEIEAPGLARGQRVYTISADVADEAQAAQAIDQAVAELGPPDILINSAGYAQPGHFLELPSSVFRQTMDINFFGSLYPTQAAVAHMAGRGRGHIVFISSGAALLGIYGYTAYTPSKIALRGFAESLRAELKPLGIVVSIVYPPDTQTPQLDYENQTKPEETRRIVHDPLLGAGPVWKAEDVARVILRGIKKQRFSIAPGWQMTLMVYAGSILAPLLNWWYDRIVVKVRRERRAHERATGRTPDDITG